MTIVLATKNPGKIREMKELLGALPVKLLTLEDFPALDMPEERGRTFTENALAKARFVAGETSFPALADDSGLEVDLLGKRPGVYSARYAGPGASDIDNYMKLLGELKGVPAAMRTARFRCAVALVLPGAAAADSVKVFDGTLEGRVAEAPAGAHGFGYDPVFLLPETGRTLAELSPGEKNTISHRAGALAKLREWLARQEDA